MSLATAPLFLLWAAEMGGYRNMASRPVPPLVALNRNRTHADVHLCVWAPDMTLLWSISRHLNPVGREASWGLWLGVDWYADKKVGQIDVRGPSGVDVWEAQEMSDRTWRAMPPIQEF